MYMLQIFLALYVLMLTLNRMSTTPSFETEAAAGSATEHAQSNPLLILSAAGSSGKTTAPVILQMN